MVVKGGGGRPRPSDPPASSTAGRPDAVRSCSAASGPRSACPCSSLGATAQGLRTTGFVSGFPTSPLAGLDQALWQARRYLEVHDIRFQQSLDGDLAATAGWGTGQVGSVPGAEADGVFALWYGK